MGKVINLLQTIGGPYLGTISLKSSIFRRPAGVSPMFISMKTTGRVVLPLELMMGVGDNEVTRDR